MSHDDNEVYTPTTKISSFKEEYDSIINQYKQFIPTPNINQNDWDKFLKNSTLPRKDLEIHGPVLGDEHDYPYYWLECDGIITIYIRIPDNEPIEVDSKQIKSKYISGKFWDEVELINFDRNKIMSTIKFQTKTHFPVIIRGGDDVDPLSSYFLGMLALTLNNLDYAINWMTKASIDGCTTSPHFLGRFLINQNRINEAIYWLTKAVLLNLDLVCMISLASLIADSKVPYKHYELAENILCEAATRGDSDAQGSLAKLYLTGGGPIKVDEQKGMKLLEQVAIKSGLDKSTIQVVQKASKDVDNEENPANKESPLVDIAISIGIVGAVVGVAYFSFRRFFKGV